MQHYLRTITLLALLCAAAIIAMSAGCRSTAANSLPGANAAIYGVAAHVESAEAHVQAAKPHTREPGTTRLTAASEEHGLALRDAQAAKLALDKAQDERDTLTDANALLEARWYVRWGRWIERMLWIVGITWLVAGVLSVVLGLGNPLSWMGWIGKQLRLLLPAMNVFSWVRGWIESRKGK
jgi:hypothetical protein